MRLCRKKFRRIFHISDPESLATAPKSEQLILVDRLWLETVYQEKTNIEAIPYPSKQSLCRLILSSGTTGELKAIPMTWDILEKRCFDRHVFDPQRGCELALFDLSTSIGLYALFKALMSGLPLVFPFDYQQIQKDFKHLDITNISGSPSHLSSLLNQMDLQTDIRPNPVKAITLTGSLARPQLLALISNKLCKNITIYYAATETSRIASFCANSSFNSIDTAGYLFPNVIVEIVDEQHKVLSQGQVGLIRIKTPYMVHEYFNHPLATAASFQDGWFYPDDLGFLREDGMLILAGRRTDLINIGGAKVNPNKIDQFLIKQTGVLDALSVGIENELGIENIWTAIVVQKNTHLSELHEKVAKLEPIYRPAKMIVVDDIPRNQAGKPLRTELKKLFLQN